LAVGDVGADRLSELALEEALGETARALHRGKGHAVFILIVFRLLGSLLGFSPARFCLAVVAVDGDGQRLASAAG